MKLERLLELAGVEPTLPKEDDKISEGAIENSVARFITFC